MAEELIHYKLKDGNDFLKNVLFCINSVINQSEKLNKLE